MTEATVIPCIVGDASTEDLRDIRPGQHNTHPRRRVRVLKAEDCPPSKALVWTNPTEKTQALGSWRRAVIRLFGNFGRTLRIAWTISELAGQKGYAFPSDSYLSQDVGIPVSKVQESLTLLERADAIYRVHVGATRRIYLNKRIIDVVALPPTAGGRASPLLRGGTLPSEAGGQRNKERGTSVRAGRRPSTADAARLAAEHRERTRNGEKPPNIFAEDQETNHRGSSERRRTQSDP